jgi:hypothetical protein
MSNQRSFSFVKYLKVNLMHKHFKTITQIKYYYDNPCFSSCFSAVLSVSCGCVTAYKRLESLLSNSEEFKHEVLNHNLVGKCNVLNYS